MSVAKHVAKFGKLGSVYVAGGIVPKVLSVFLLPLFTFYLVPQQMGIVALCLRVFGPLSVVLQVGMWSSMKSLYFRVDSDVRKNLVRTALLGQLLVSSVLVIILGFAGGWIAPHILTRVPLSYLRVQQLWWLILIQCLAFGIMSLGLGLAQLREKPLMSVAITNAQFLAQTLFGLAAVVWLGWQGFGRWVTITVGTVVAGAFGFGYAWSRSSGRFRLDQFKLLLVTGIVFIPHTLSGVLAPAINGWMLNKLGTTAQLGIYSVAYMFPEMIQMPLFAIGNSAYPTLAQLMRDGDDEAKRQQSRIYSLLLLTVCFMVLLVALFSPSAIRVLADIKYHDAVAIAPIIAFAFLFQGVYLVVSQPVFYRGGGLWLALGTVSSVVVSLLVSWILIPRFGIAGAGWALVASFASRFAVAALVSAHVYPLRWEYQKLLPAFGVTIILGAIGWIVDAQFGTWPATAMKMFLMVLFVPALIAVGAVTSLELRSAGNIIRPKLNQLRILFKLSDDR